MPVVLNLNLKGHCIETEAKNEFNRLMDRYFNTDDTEGEIEGEIELLRDFLEESDFPKLRSSDMRLSGEKDSLVVIKRDDNGKICIEFL